MNFMRPATNNAITEICKLSRKSRFTFLTQAVILSLLAD